MQNPHRPPIASPDGNLGPLPSVPAVRGDWNSAPKIVRGWAYPLTWLSIVVLPFLFVVVLLPNPNSSVERPALVLLYPLLFVFNIALNRGLKNGKRWAWIGQIPLSCLGLLGFPVGTLIHGYVLSQWFKPEPQAWFEQS